MDELPFGNQIEKGIWDFNKAAGKRIIADLGSAISKMLATGTEPFFRRDMGERHFSATSISAGYGLWFLSGIASCLTGTTISPILNLMGFSTIAQLCHGIIYPVLTSLVVLFFYRRFAKENVIHLAQFRADGKTYHSRSRGQPRWEPSEERAIRIGGSIVLLLFAPVVGVAFIVSMGTCANLAAQQAAALHDRYLDALDAQIEGELLQDALLGKCPPEITYLYKPLSSDLKPELREDIAAAAVGKPVKIVAQGPRGAGVATEPELVQQS